ncbi:hypothetical protein D9M71_559410 [compost metagenome]
MGQHRHRLQRRQGQGRAGRQRTGGLLGPDLQARIYEQAQAVRRSHSRQRPGTTARRAQLPGPTAPQQEPGGLQESRSTADESAAIRELLPFLEVHQRFGQRQHLCGGRLFRRHPAGRKPCKRSKQWGEHRLFDPQGRCGDLVRHGGDAGRCAG